MMMPNEKLFHCKDQAKRGRERGPDSRKGEKYWRIEGNHMKIFE